MKPEDLPANIKQRNPEVFGTPTTYEDRKAEYDKGQEIKFQEDAETMLKFRGYEPRTRKALNAGRPRNGWYYHHTIAQRNGFLLDLVVMPHDRPAFEIELKAQGGRLQKEQRQIISQHDRACACRTLTAFEKALDAWG